MTEILMNEWNPVDVSHPGESLGETLEVLGMSQAELAQRMGRPRKTINEIVKGKASIVAETALQLEHVLGVEASFWLARQRLFDAARARRAEDEGLVRDAAWLKVVPYAQLVKRGWLPKRKSKADAVRDALGFYRCASVKAFREHFEFSRASFRQSKAFSSDPLTVATWLRRCELEAAKVDVDAYSPERLSSSLQALRGCSLSAAGSGLVQAREILARAGVALVWVEPLSGSRLSGAAFPLHDRRVVALTLRHGTDDHLWFTLFHEVAHLLLHDGQEIFIDDDPDPTVDREAQADAFARDVLIPSERWQELFDRPRFPERVVVDFARELGIAPGVVVGRLQHDALLRRTELNHLKRPVRWVSGEVG